MNTNKIIVTILFSIISFSAFANISAGNKAYKQRQYTALQAVRKRNLMILLCFVCLSLCYFLLRSKKES